MRRVLALSLVIVLVGCEKLAIAPSTITAQRLTSSNSTGLLTAYTALPTQINAPAAAPLLNDADKVKAHIAFLEKFFQSFPTMKDTVSKLYGELASDSPSTNAARGLQAGAPNGDFCAGDAGGPPNPACPRKCAWAAAVASAYTCATAHALAKAWAVAYATANASCPDGTSAFGWGLGWGWAVDEDFETKCAAAFGYGYAYACTDGTGGAGAGAGVSIWSSFAGGALASNATSNPTSATSPRPICDLVTAE